MTNASRLALPCGVGASERLRRNANVCEEHLEDGGCALADRGQRALEASAGDDGVTLELR